MTADLQVTGDAALDAALANFDRKIVRKWIRKALRDGAKAVAANYRATVPVDSGAMRDSLIVRSARRLRRGQLGVAVIVDATRLFAHQLKRRGRGLWYRRKGAKNTERFFYPAVVELGDRDTPAQRPLRSALYDSENYLRDQFVKDIRAALAEAERTAQSPATGAAGAIAEALDLEPAGGGA